MRIFSQLHARQRGRAAIGELASLQRNLVERGQLIEAGVTRGMIRTLCANGTLCLVLPRVYAVGTPLLPPYGDETAALLHLRHDAVISHDSAAAMWGLAESPDTIHVTLIGRGLRRRDGLQLYRVPQLDSRDVRLRNGLPVTAPARTLIDYAASATAIELSDAAGDARAMRLVTDDQFDAALQRAPGRTGTQAVNALRATAEGRLLTRSHVERILIRLLTDAGLPIPLTNALVNGHEVDAYWPEHNLVLEIDSWRHHSSERAFENDRARDQDHTARRTRSLRFTYRQLTKESLRTVAKIVETLAAGP